MMHRASTGVGLEVRLSMQTTSIIQACILGYESGDEACTVDASRQARCCLGKPGPMLGPASASQGVHKSARPKSRCRPLNGRWNPPHHRIAASPRQGSTYLRRTSRVTRFRLRPPTPSSGRATRRSVSGEGGATSRLRRGFELGRMNEGRVGSTRVRSGRAEGCLREGRGAERLRDVRRRNGGSRFDA